MASSVPSASLGPTGVIVPAQADILQGVLADMNAAFGGNLNTSLATLSTPQGQLASSLAAYIADKNSMFSYLVSQVDPAYAQGFMQDAIARIFGLTRLPATYTYVSATCYGVPETAIPPNAQAMDTAGNLYSTVGGTIGVGGSVVLTFTALTPGPIGCVAGALSRIMTTVPGWDRITNAYGTDTLPLTLGLPIENAQAFEYRRQNSLYINAQSMTQSVMGAVMASGANIPNIPVDCYVYDNALNTPASVGGITVPANSLYVAVEGGDPTSIATAIWTKKSVGCSYAPSTSFTATTATSTVLTVTDVACGILAVGQTVIGAGVPLNAYISSLGTGTGGTGTYNLSVATTASASGVPMLSATQVQVVDSAFFSPSPTYNVQYTVPAPVPIYVKVSLVNNANLPAGVLALIQGSATPATPAEAGILGAFLGVDGGQKARIGATVFGSRFYSAVLAAVPQAQIVNIQVGLTASPTGQSVTPQINQYPCTDAAHITLTLV